MGLQILFNKWIEESQGSIIQLMNKDRIPVGALYLDKIKTADFIISETKTAEKYYIYINGVAIFFTYYRKLQNAPEGP